MEKNKPDRIIYYLNKAIKVDIRPAEGYFEICDENGGDLGDVRIKIDVTALDRFITILSCTKTSFK